MEIGPFLPIEGDITSLKRLINVYMCIPGDRRAFGTKSGRYLRAYLLI